MSQWSFDDANGDGIECAKRISIPALVIGNSADDGITPSHTNALFDAIGHDTKELYTVKGANHYYFGQPEKSTEAVEYCVGWMQKQGLLEDY